jgi:hypothetical protein
VLLLKSLPPTLRQNPFPFCCSLEAMLDNDDPNGGIGE